MSTFEGADQCPPADAVAWSRLWQSGVLHSCCSGIDGNYDHEFEAFWQARFAALGEGARVVDVGTGNGAVPLLAAEAARFAGVRLDIHGVDLADIDPLRDVPDGARRFDGIRFHPRTSMTALPFDDGSVDLLCSQFAFEYAAREPAIAELLRVTGRHGEAAMILHSADSLVARVSQQQLHEAAWLLDDSRVLPAAATLAAIVAAAPDAAARAALACDARAEAARHDFNRQAQALLARIEAQPDAAVLQQVAQQLGRLLADPGGDPDQARQRIASLREWVDGEHQRLALMVAASLDEPALQDCVARLSAGGRTVQTGRLLYQGRIPMGWTLRVHG